MGNSGISRAEVCPPAFGHSELLRRGQKQAVCAGLGSSHSVVGGTPNTEAISGCGGSEQGGQETGTQAQEEQQTNEREKRPRNRKVALAESRRVTVGRQGIFTQANRLNAHP